MSIQNTNAAAGQVKTNAARKRKLTRTIRVVGKLGGFKIDSSKIRPDHFKSLQKRRGNYLIAIEKGKIVEIRDFATYHLSKNRFRTLLEYYSKTGEITAQNLDEFTVSIKKERNVEH